MLSLPRQNTIMPLSDPLHQVGRYFDFWLNIICFAIEKKHKKKGETKMFDMNIIASHQKICAGIFQLLVDKRLIQVMWTSFCINFSYNSTCLHHILSVIHYTICGAVCFQFTHFPCDDWENKHILSYYHQIGSINYYLLVKIWKEIRNGEICCEVIQLNRFI